MTELKQEDLDNLVRKLGILDEEVVAEHQQFISCHPDGKMTQDKFIMKCLEKEDSTEEKAVALFNVFDKDENGTMDFIEYMLAANATTLRCCQTVGEYEKWRRQISLVDRSPCSLRGVQPTPERTIGFFAKNFQTYHAGKYGIGV